MTPEHDGENARAQTLDAVESIAHALHGKLLSIQGFTQALLQKTDDPETRDLLDYIITDAATAQQQLKSGVTCLQLIHTPRFDERLDMNTLAQQAMRDCSGSLDVDGLETSIEPLEDAVGDRKMVSLLLTSLLHNAVKFTRGVRPRRVVVSSAAVDDWRRYTVSDTGVGFDDALQDRARGLFRKLHQDESIPGLGAGLAMAHIIVERHGGDLTCESRPGSGARISFTLPAHSREADR